jgi:DNA-binding NarL/FixJ family response regulator
MKKTKLSVFIADDHPIFRRGLCEVIEEEDDLNLAGQASAGDEALKSILETRPAIAILDVNMPGMSGLEVARQVLRKLTATKVVLLTMHEDEDLFNEAINSGVSAYVLKENAVEDLVHAIRAVANGKTFISPSVSGYLLRRGQHREELRKEKPGLEMLTETEKRVLKLIAEDKTSKEIADLLGISVRTVETHRQHISSKLNLSGTHSLVKFAFSNKSKL